MKKMEMALVCFLNEFHRKMIYRYEEYQLLHGVKYRKQMSEELLKLLRENYSWNCFKAAYELKTYYMENNLLSNTIVLKMRPEFPEDHELPNIKIHSTVDGTVHEYTHHAIEIFKEHNRYKVLDAIHRDESVWLESYLDDICRINDCPRERLRYDMGYLAPAHAFADNMQELSDLMKYLDRQYNVGKPRVNLINIPESEEPAILLSDDMIMDFDAFGREFGCTGEEVILSYTKIYGKMMSIRFNLLHLLCLGHIMRDPLFSRILAEGIFDDAKICRMMEDLCI